jgi:tRNA (mo5U34)-methyltransferase
VSSENSTFQKSRYSKKEILERISKIAFWGQSIPLPYGIITPGRVMRNLDTIERLQLPQSLSGKRILDIGAWDGYYSFECEKRGAQVLAIDNLNRMKRPDEVKFAHLGNRGFETAKDILNSDVKFKNLDVYDIDPKEIGTFDIVLFLGVLYHLKHPTLALEKISKVTNDQLIIETECLRSPIIRRSMLEYIESDHLNQDPTNFCRPNISWIKSVLMDLGFSKIDILHKSISKKSIKSLIKMDLLMSGRVILKAYK